MLNFQTGKKYLPQISQPGCPISYPRPSEKVMRDKIKELKIEREAKIACSSDDSINFLWQPKLLPLYSKVEYLNHGARGLSCFWNVFRVILVSSLSVLFALRFVQPEPDLLDQMMIFYEG